MNRCILIVVKGRVQGVSFRISAQMQAIKLNVCGFVRNIDSGHVEIFAQGDPVALEQLVTWCHHGPSLAKVTEVAVSEYDSNEVFSDFQIR